MAGWFDTYAKFAVSLPGIATTRRMFHERVSVRPGCARLGCQQASSSDITDFPLRCHDVRLAIYLVRADLFRVTWESLAALTIQRAVCGLHGRNPYISGPIIRWISMVFLQTLGVSGSPLMSADH